MFSGTGHLPHVLVLVSGVPPTSRASHTAAVVAAFDGLLRYDIPLSRLSAAPDGQTSHCALVPQPFCGFAYGGCTVVGRTSLPSFVAGIYRTVVSVR